MFPVVQVATFKNNGDRKTHFVLPDMTRTSLTVWKDTRDAVLLPLDGLPTFKGKVEYTCYITEQTILFCVEIVILNFHSGAPSARKAAMRSTIDIGTEPHACLETDTHETLFSC